MAITLVQLPNNQSVPVITNWTPMTGYMVFSNTNNSSLFYQKLILRVRLGDITGEIVALMKQRGNGYSVDIQNNNARAFFDVREIANAQVVDTYFNQNCDGAPFQSIHTVGASTGTNSSSGTQLTALPFSVNGNRSQAKFQIVKLHVQAGEESSTSISASPTSTFNVTAQGQDNQYYLQASLPLEAPRFVTGGGGSVNTTYIQGIAFNSFRLTSSASRFLSTIIPTEFTVGGTNINGYRNNVFFDTDTNQGDLHTLAFLNGSAFNSEGASMEVEYFDSSNSSIGSYAFDNLDTTGGYSPYVTPTDDGQRLLYFGCGPGNLQAQSDNTSARPSNNSSFVYYTVQAKSATSGGGSDRSAKYYFFKDNSCTKFVQSKRRLAFINSVGGYDYLNFTMRNTQTIDIKRDNYDKMLGVFSGSKYRYDNADRGTTTVKVHSKIKETLQSDYIPQSQGQLFADLFLSRRVDMLVSFMSGSTQVNVVYPVVVTDNSFVIKKSETDGLIQYTVNIEYANPYNNNS
tara:strand:- start:2711 stop:4255 length:1545 start_codon:yes stop_codon:yes gene_type:complete